MNYVNQSMAVLHLNYYEYFNIFIVVRTYIKIIVFYLKTITNLENIASRL